MVNTLLGGYLRARRERLDPGSVGLPARSGRRVTGLRREEVAALAGISADYYQRLEQGRDRHPSPQIIEALARVLRLDEAARHYLEDLAATDPADLRLGHEEPLDDPVPVGTLHLLDALELPAFVTGRRMDVLAANRAAQALSPTLTPGRNRVRDVLLDPRERERFEDWDLATARIVAVFRAHVGADAPLPPIAALIHELLASSDRFRVLWNEHEVTDRDESPGGSAASRTDDAALGRERLAIEGVRGQRLVVFYNVR